MLHETERNSVCYCRERWEKELDWMALHGITSPLISSGREVVMREVFLKQGMSEDAILAVPLFTPLNLLCWMPSLPASRPYITSIPSQLNFSIAIFTNMFLLQFFTGPGFLAWHRMGNLKGFAGPLPADYLSRAEELTRKILTRARELGMTPVLPGFSGQVNDLCVASCLTHEL